jgi:transcriptional regulator with XRE-family HTH domain
MVSSGDDMRYEIMKYENIRNIRIDRGYTQKQIAEYLGISQNTYSQYENGQRQIPIEMLIALAQYYKTSTDYILELTDIKKPYPKK